MARPRHFDSPEEMEERIEEYFAQSDEITMTGLCNYLGISKQSLSDYQKRDEFSDLVKASRQKVEEQVEKLLLYGKAPTGAIFWLKNHGGYSDRQEVSGPGGGPIQTITLDMSPEEATKLYQQMVKGNLTG